MEYFTRLEEIEPNVYGVTLRRCANIYGDIAHMAIENYRSGNVPTFDYEFEELQFIGIDKFKIRIAYDWPCEGKTYRVGLIDQDLFGWSSNKRADIFCQWMYERRIKFDIAREEGLPNWNELISNKRKLKIPLMRYGCGYIVSYCMTLKDIIMDHFNNNEVRKRIYDALLYSYSDTGRNLRKLLRQKNQITAAAYLLKETAIEKKSIEKNNKTAELWNKRM